MILWPAAAALRATSAGKVVAATGGRSEAHALSRAIAPSLSCPRRPLSARRSAAFSLLTASAVAEHARRCAGASALTGSILARRHQARSIQRPV